MVSMVLPRFITKPVALSVCLASIALACPSPTMAAPGSSLNLPIPASTEIGGPPADYVLGGGDRVRVTVLDVPEYSGEYQVPPGGTLYVPLIGSVSVQGLTQSQAADLISAKYARFLKRPLVTVSLITPRPINVVIAGEVNSPGSYVLVSQAGGASGIQSATVGTAIQQAQGVTLAADITHVELRRKQGLGLPDQLIVIDLRNLVQTGNQPGDLNLRDGDTILVPTTTNTNLSEVRSFATANFSAPQAIPRTVTVVGEVNRPGPYVVIGGATSGQTTLTQGGTITQGSGNTAGLPTVTRAIQLAGGITSQANIRDIKIRRLTKTGSQEIINVDLMRLVTVGDVNQDTIVQEGDSIIVPRAANLTAAEQTQIASTNISPDTIQISIVGEVRSPGLVRIPPNTPLNQALLDAGGFNNGRADRKAVDLIRLNPNGTVTKRLVKINFTNGLNEDTNPTLRNNDIIVVSRNGLAKTGDTLGTVLTPLGSLLSVFGIINLFR